MDPTIEPTAIVERPKAVTRAAQLLSASLGIGLIRAIFGLTPRVSGVPMVFALLIVFAFFGIGFILILRISATRWMKIIKWVLLALSGALAVVALLTLISANYGAARNYAVASVFAYLAYKRRNWARIILLVVVLVGLPFAIRANLVELKQSTVSGSLSIIIALLQLTGTYLLFTKNSNRWFKTRK